MKDNPANANLDNMISLAEQTLFDVIKVATGRIEVHSDLEDWIEVYFLCSDLMSRMKSIRKAFKYYRFDNYQSQSLKFAPPVNVGKVKLVPTHKSKN